MIAIRGWYLLENACPCGQAVWVPDGEVGPVTCHACKCKVKPDKKKLDVPK